MHILPIHMGVPDPVLWGLDDVQLLKVGAGLVVVGWLWRQTARHVLPLARLPTRRPGANPLRLRRTRSCGTNHPGAAARRERRLLE